MSQPGFAIEPRKERAAPPVPRISVIIPTYNRDRYISATIDSVLQQTATSVEVIVVDDGSTDETPERVRAYGPRVRYIRTANRRTAHARNVGMAYARGEYLAFLDDDDLYYPYMLELESRVLDRYPDLGMVYAEMSAFDDHGYFDRYHLRTYHSSAYRDPALTYDRIFEASVRLGDSGVLPAGLATSDADLLERRIYFGNIFDSYLENIVVFQNNMMVRRSVVEAIGARNENTRYYEELDYILRIARGHRIGFVDVPTYKLRYHAGQLSSMSGADGRDVWMRKQRELLRIVKRQALADSAYYERHRDRIDRHLAHLHRAVAVPLMAAGGSATRQRHNARRARLYLDRCARLGRPNRGLWLLSHAPLTFRRLGLGLEASFRTISHRLKSGVRRTS